MNVNLLPERRTLLLPAPLTHEPSTLPSTLERGTEEGIGEWAEVHGSREGEEGGLGFRFGFKGWSGHGPNHAFQERVSDAIDLASLISATAPLDEAAAWFERLHGGDAQLMKVILLP